jgi:capsular polysaccharide biosynthesis protein
VGGWLCPSVGDGGPLDGLGGLRQLTISGFVRLLRRHWLLVAACAVIGVTIAISLALFVVRPSYSTTVKLYVSGTGLTADDQLKNGEYVRTRISSYADLVSSHEVLQAARVNLGLPMSSSASSRDLADSISASNPLDTMIIDLTVRDSSPQRAQRVAAAISQAYESVVPRLESSSVSKLVSKQSPVRINVVSAPALPTERDSPNRKLYAAVGLLVGIGVGAGAASLLEWRRRPANRDSRVRRQQQRRTSPIKGTISWPDWPDSAPSAAHRKQENPVEVQKQENPVEVQKQENPVEVQKQENPVEVQKQENPVEVFVVPNRAGSDGNGAYEWPPPWWIGGQVR